MRVWSLHPRYLDPVGLVALWRETLLARAVLGGRTRGYHHHPQLIRFRSTRNPVVSIDRYLAAVFDEATRRGYAFDESKFIRRRSARLIEVTAGQVSFEWGHLRKKLRQRDPPRYRETRGIEVPAPHPLFQVVAGPIAEWERG